MWKDETISFQELAEKGKHYDELTIEGGLPYALDFLYWSGLIPPDVIHQRGNSNPRTSLDYDAIPVGYLAEVAYEWDKDGSAPVDSFLTMIAFEVNGTDQHTVVNETMVDLGRR